MKVTDNLQNDISCAPDWFQDSITHESQCKTIISENHKVAYKVWGNKDNKNVIFLETDGGKNNVKRHKLIYGNIPICIAIHIPT